MPTGTFVCALLSNEVPTNATRGTTGTKAKRDGANDALATEKSARAGKKQNAKKGPLPQPTVLLLSNFILLMCGTITGDFQ